MGLTVHLRDEGGEVSAQVFDTRNLLHRQLTMVSDRLLGGIDWYGDTIFKCPRIREFIPAWTPLLNNAISPDDETLLTDILTLAKESLENVHPYLKFEGD